MPLQEPEIEVLPEESKAGELGHEKLVTVTVIERTTTTQSGVH